MIKASPKAQTIAVAWLAGVLALSWGSASAQTVTNTNAARAAAAGVGVGAGTGAGSGSAAPGSPGASTGNPSQSTGARYVESCQQALERGVANASCRGPLYANEIAQLKDDALRSNNPNLLTLLGDAYQSNRSGVSDIGQAYRWYLLAAVRGDPRAMQRLSDLYKDGRGAPRDNIKALGYARLAQRMAPPGSANARQATDTVSSLGKGMATEEIVQADRFANELEESMKRQQARADESGAASEATPALTPAPAPANPSLTGRLPGQTTAQTDGAAARPPLQGGMPGSVLSGSQNPPTLPSR